MKVTVANSTNIVFAMAMTTMMMVFNSLVVDVVADNGSRKLKARERMKQDRMEREARILAGGDTSGLVFSRGYICIIKPTDNTWAFPNGLVPGADYLVGSSMFQSGGIYDPADIKIVDRVGTSKADRFESYAQFDTWIDGTEELYPDSEGFLHDEKIQQVSGPETDNPTNHPNETFTEFFPHRFQFAGQRQPLFVPQADPGYFMNGECVTTSTIVNLITGHSCLLNLCLGGGGYNCLAIYAGSKFVFDPLAVTLVDEYGDSKRGINPTIEVQTVNYTQGNNEPGVNLTQAEYTANANRFVPALPPSYPGTIIGGTGIFVGAVGYVDITTVTASTLPPWQFMRSGDPTVLISARNSQVGYITQKINVVTNRPLPAAP